jgi:hypothetical protein
MLPMYVVWAGAKELNLHVMEKYDFLQYTI